MPYPLPLSSGRYWLLGVWPVFFTTNILWEEFVWRPLRRSAERWQRQRGLAPSEGHSPRVLRVPRTGVASALVQVGVPSDVRSFALLRFTVGAEAGHRLFVTRSILLIFVLLRGLAWYGARTTAQLLTRAKLAWPPARTSSA